MDSTTKGNGLIGRAMDIISGGVRADLTQPGEATGYTPRGEGTPVRAAPVSAEGAEASPFPGIGGSITLDGRDVSHVVAQLPEPARSRLIALIDEREDRHAVVRKLGDDKHEKWLTLKQAEQRLSDMTSVEGARRLGSTFAYSPDSDDPIMVQAREKLERARADYDHIQSRYDRAAERWRHTAKVTGSLVRYLEGLRGQPIELFDGEPAKMPKGKDALSEIEKCRARLAELRADLKEVEAAPITSEKAWGKIEAEIARLAEQGRPSVFKNVDHDGVPVTWPTRNILEELYRLADTPHIAAKGPDVLSVMVWLHKDQLLDRLRDELAEAADDDAALDDTERARRVAEIRAEMLATERREVDLIDGAEVEIAYREKTDPRALLRLSSDMPAAERN